MPLWHLTCAARTSACPGVVAASGSHSFLALLQCSLSTVSSGGSRSRDQEALLGGVAGARAPRGAAALGKRPVVEFSFSFQLGFCESL